jgi:hypothetical protein
MSDQPHTTPRRIQRRRVKGWRMPSGAISVSRPGRWGNPFAVGKPYLTVHGRTYYVRDPAHAVKLFREDVARRPIIRLEIARELRGRDLVCWCPLDRSCHADVLLELANG